MNLICLKHPSYDGESSPVLACKTCCSIFIGVIRAKNAQGQTIDTQKWLTDKSREAQEAVKKRVHANYGFDPRSI